MVCKTLGGTYFYMEKDGNKMNLPEGWPTKEMVDKAVIVLRDRAYIPLEDGRRLANLMIRAAFAAAPTPPTQEDEPVAYMDVHYNCDLYKNKPEQIDVIPLYTRPDDKLRRAAEEAYEILKAYLDDYGGDDCEYMTLENLRAALEK